MQVNGLEHAMIETSIERAFHIIRLPPAGLSNDNHAPAVILVPDTPACLVSVQPGQADIQEYDSRVECHGATMALSRSCENISKRYGNWSAAIPIPVTRIASIV